MTHSFCKSMVENTLNFYIFKYVDFMKISRLYSTLLTKCDMRGKFLPYKFVKHNSKFFRVSEIEKLVRNC